MAETTTGNTTTSTTAATSTPAASTTTTATTPTPSAPPSNPIAALSEADRAAYFAGDRKVIARVAAAFANAGQDAPPPGVAAPEPNDPNNWRMWDTNSRATAGAVQAELQRLMPAYLNADDPNHKQAVLRVLELRAQSDMDNAEAPFPETLDQLEDVTSLRAQTGLKPPVLSPSMAQEWQPEREAEYITWTVFDQGIPVSTAQDVMNWYSSKYGEYDSPDTEAEFMARYKGRLSPRQIERLVTFAKSVRGGAAG